MRFDARTRCLEVKLLLHGAPNSGRRTNLRHLADTLPHQPGQHTLHAPLVHRDFDLGTVLGQRVRSRCVCLPDNPALHRLRRAVLQGVDGVVFVADSRRERQAANLDALRALTAAMLDTQASLDSLPIVFQWNKRDVRSPLPVQVLEEELNPRGAEAIPAIARSGIGVWRTWRRVVELAIEAAQEPLLRAEGA